MIENTFDILEHHFRLIIYMLFYISPIIKKSRIGTKIQQETINLQMNVKSN